MRPSRLYCWMAGSLPSACSQFRSRSAGSAWQVANGSRSCRATHNPGSTVNRRKKNTAANDEWLPLSILCVPAFSAPGDNIGAGHLLPGSLKGDNGVARLIKRIGFLNELLLDGQLIKPTSMVARFVKYPTTERCYRGRSAAASVRPTGVDPVWLHNALCDFNAMAIDPEFVYRPKIDEAQNLSTIVATEAIPEEALEPIAVQLQAALDERDVMISQLHSSTSWRLTAPLRALKRLGGTK